MPIFTAIGTAIAGALFAGSTFAATLISGALVFGARLGISYLNRPKKRKYAAVQGEIQYGSDVPVGAMFGTGMAKGHRAFYAKYGKGNKYNSDVFLLSNGWCDGLEAIFFYGEKKALVPTATIGGETARFLVDGYGTKLSIRFYDGRPGQPVDSKLVLDSALLGVTWKSTSVCAGLCYVIVDREYDSALFGKGIPEFSFVLRGLRLYDPRKDSTVAGGSGTHRVNDPSTWQFSRNPAVQRLNYQLGIKGLISGRTLIGEGKSLGQLDLSSYFAAMNVSDTIRAGKPTYQSAIYAQSDDDHTEILKEFDDAMAGYGVNRRGLSGVIPGAPQIPILEITPDDIPVDREQEVSKRKSSFDKYNMMSGQFTSPESQWSAESLKPIVVNADIAADKRPRQTANDFLQVSDPDIAQYLLNIRYRQNRKGGQATVPVSRRVGLKVQEGEWVTFDGMTWLITEWRCDEQFRFTLVLTETGSDIYADGDIEPGPVVIPSPPQVNPSLLTTVQNFRAEVGMINGEDGFEQPALHFIWDPPQDPTITEVRFFYRIHGTTREFQDKSSDPESGEYTTSKDVQSGVFYECRATITTVPDRFKTFTPYVTTDTTTGRFKVYLPGVIDDVLRNLQQHLEWIAESVHYHTDELDRVGQLASSNGAQAASDKFELRASIGEVTSSYKRDILVVATATEAAIIRVEDLEAVINDPVTGLAATASAVDALSVTVNDPGTGLVATANRVTALTATVGNFSASNLFRSTVEATQAGALATIGLSVAATGPGATSQAALFLSALTGGLSEIGMVADRIYMVNGANKRRPFVFTGGVLYLDDVRATSLSALSATLGAVDISSAIIGSLIVGTSNLGIDSVTSTGSAGPAAPPFSLTADMPSPNRSLLQFKYSVSVSNPGSSGVTRSATFSVVNNTTGATVYSKSFSVNSGSSLNIDETEFFFGQNAAGVNSFTATFQLSGSMNTTGLTGSLIALWWKR
ncbi:hypothetical protein SAMN05428967_4478 [Phyllobacterium sp. YR620]|uniref:phage tail protein n=1 Tax=Phyllobacterium sp. YR620 TaxID=1881066 RepID=UPI0008803711|nr:phage tail protein [Phyllobacterium sp. YR620]SDP92552.1 hypothetical protein SAMN05428967_4478 [Phyllobacterium sp. YR620]